jgi:hypothetical protein
MMSASNELERFTAAHKFLEDLYDGKPGAALILLWTVRGEEKRSQFFADIVDAASFAISQTDANVYVGVGWRKVDVGPFRRGKAEEVGGIVGFWADLDIAGPGHIDSKKVYPPSEEAARAVLGLLPLAPSLIVRTGGGLHAWWLFREPWEFETEGERLQAAQLAKEWGATIRAVAGGRGYDIDGVWDLSRHLRVVGTFRAKEGDPEPKLVELVEDNGARYNPSDFEPHVVRLDERGTPSYDTGALALDAAANPPLEKFTALCAIEPKFLASFNRQRKDLKDQSQSAYDLSLATIAVMAEWTDQEIAYLIIAARRKSGDKPEKALRQDYIADRIRHARANQQREQQQLADAAVREAAVDDLQAEVRALPAPEPGAEGAPTPRIPDAARRRILDKLSVVFGTKVVGIVQHGRYKALYSLVLEDLKEVSLGPVNVVLNPTQMRGRLYEAVGHTMPVYKIETWLKVAQAIAKVTDVLETPESTRKSELGAWLQAYIGDRPQFVGDKWSAALVNNDPYVRGGVIGVHAASMLKFIKLQYLVDVEIQELRDRLRATGFATKTVGARTSAGQVTRTYWLGPASLLEPPSCDDLP